MRDESGGRPAALAAELRSLAQRCLGDTPPPPQELEAGLEDGAATIVQLELRLRRLRNAADEVASHEYDAGTAALADRVEELRQALGALREAIAGPASAARLDFVLPSPEPRRRDR